MKLWAKILLGVVALIAVAAGSAAAFVSVSWDKRYDDVEGPDLKVSTDSAVIARGEYLVRGPAHCANCHIAGPEDGQRAEAGEEVPMRGGLTLFSGPLGTIRTANLTPDSATGIGRYTDRQLFRMLRNNIKPDGTSSLAPIMPFNMMADEDLVAIVSYIRTQEPVRHEVAPPTYTTLGKVIRTAMPAFKPRLGHTAPATAPAQAPTKERGEYMARFVANCLGCHTEFDRATGKTVVPDFAGGGTFSAEENFNADGFSFRSPNLTPDTSGVLVRIGSKENWVKRFRQGRVHKGSPMPWGPFSRMADADLEALWVYFNSLTPVLNSVGPTVYKDTAAKGN